MTSDDPPRPSHRISVDTSRPAAPRSPPSGPVDAIDTLHALTDLAITADADARRRKLQTSRSPARHSTVPTRRSARRCGTTPPTALYMTTFDICTSGTGSGRSPATPHRCDARHAAGARWSNAGTALCRALRLGRRPSHITFCPFDRGPSITARPHTWPAEFVGAAVARQARDARRHGLRQVTAAFLIGGQFTSWAPHCVIVSYMR